MRRLQSGCRQKRALLRNGQASEEGHVGSCPFAVNLLRPWRAHLYGSAWLRIRLASCSRLICSAGASTPVLRDWLLTHSRAYTARDAVWRELILRARLDGPAWVVAAAGMALPALRRCAGQLRVGWSGDAHDIDAEILTAFLAALRDGWTCPSQRHTRRCAWPRGGLGSSCVRVSVRRCPSTMWSTWSGLALPPFPTAILTCWCSGRSGWGCSTPAMSSPTSICGWAGGRSSNRRRYGHIRRRAAHAGATHRRAHRPCSGQRAAHRCGVPTGRCGTRRERHPPGTDPRRGRHRRCGPSNRDCGGCGRLTIGYCRGPDLTVGPAVVRDRCVASPTRPPHTRARHRQRGRGRHPMPGGVASWSRASRQATCVPPPGAYSG
ncbi:hypothetical protein C5N14_28445 [Micromonospora sp. MW-13]|nr:hypothetical protein C5N14_28445 [Micromonospora sp. MW-13]